jgi:hypothetical protein
MNALECPHCHVSFVVEALNCGIFRCGVWRATGVQINPHMSEEECNSILANIWGCSRPFRVTLDAGEFQVAPCGYI